MEEVLELIHFVARYTSKVVGESCPGPVFSLRKGRVGDWGEMRGVPALLLVLPQNSGSMLIRGRVCVSM